ncbi:MAG: hypothetical protein AABY22_08085 [Nanoarchaeota archaeon]
MKRKLCKCGCGEIIKFKPHYKYTGIPNYIQEHYYNRDNKLFDEIKDKKVYCECGCGERIIIKRHHIWKGIPKFINHHQKMKFKRLCIECGRIFKGSFNAKFCSNKCGFHYRRKTGVSNRANKGNQIEKICVICGKKFYANKGGIDKVKFCSVMCMGLSKRRMGVKNIKNSIIEFTCKNCGKYFYKYFYNLAKFCCRKCYDEYRRKK